jgi:hypothetical protein
MVTKPTTMAITAMRNQDLGTGKMGADFNGMS